MLATASAWKNSVKAMVGGVGPQALKSLNSIEKIQPRMIVAPFNGNPRATIISYYSPTNASDETLMHDIWKYWTAVLTLLDLISSVYHDLHHWRSNQQPQIAEPKFYN